MGRVKKRQPAVSGVPDKNAGDEPTPGNRGAGQRPGFSNVQLGLMFGLLLAANYYGITWVKQRYWDEPAATDSASQGTLYQVAGEVEVRTLASPRTKFAEECSAAGVPVVLRNSVIEKWKAKKKWSPKYLQSRMTRITGVYQNENRWFGPYYDTSKPLTHLSQKINNYRTDLNMTAKAFFQKLHNPSEGEFLYFTGDIDQLGQWAMEDIQPLSELLLLNPKRSSINAWMGQPHVIAHCHYDGYHNFYAQLYGTKKFTLFRPTNWPGLYPYPFLHPSHAQAQVNLSSVDDLDPFPLAGKTSAVEVILQPGDLLYMPPLWFHHVESMELSISVNVWTDSDQTALMEEVFSLTPPTELVEWPSRERKTIATSVLIHAMLKELCKDRKSCRHAKSDNFLDNPNIKPLHGGFYFVYQLWTTRYRRLMELGRLPDGVHSETEESILCERMKRKDSKVLVEEVTNVLTELGVDDYVGKVSANIGKLPEDTWELWTGNFVEYLASTAVEIQLVGAFLRHFGSCLDLNAY